MLKPWRVGFRYRYYVSRPLIAEPAGATCGQRLPAASLEPLVVERIGGLLADPAALLDALQGHLESAPMQRQLVDRAGQMAKSLPGPAVPRAPGQNLGKSSLGVITSAPWYNIEVAGQRVERERHT